MVRPRRVLAVALLPLLAVALRAPPALADKKADGGAEKLLEKVAQDWIALAAVLKDKGAKAAAITCLEDAKAADPDAPGLAELETAVQAIEEAEGAAAEAAKLREKTGKDVAKVHDKVADLYAGGAGRDAALHAEHHLRALLLDPTKGRVAKVADEAKKGTFLLKAPGHELAAWVSFPGGWKAGKEFPVLVTCEGAGANFRGNAEGFRSGRGSRDVILVTPCALSATNELKPDRFPWYDPKTLQDNAAQGSRIEFDRSGLLGILDVLRTHFGAAGKVSITGFSGGGLLCYGTTLKNPDRVLLCAPACPNFLQGMDSGAPEVTDGGPKVRIFTGEKDEHREHVFGQRPGIEGQTDLAVAAFERLGYKDVQRTMLPGVGHSTCVPQVWGAVDEALGASKGKGKGK